MRKLYLFATLFGLGIPVTMMADDNDKSEVFSPTDVVFSYSRGGSSGEKCIGVFEGSKTIEGKEYSVFTITPEPFIPGVAAIPMRFDGKRVYGWYGTEADDVATGQEILLYDYEPGVGEKWPGHVFNSFGSGDYSVVQAREVNLFGAKRRVQRIADAYHAEGWLSSPYHNGNCWFYSGGISGDEFVNVECIGNVALDGFYSYPMVLDLPSGYVTPYSPSPLKEVASQDGEYRYTTIGLGVSPGNQIMRENNTWQYYSETPEYEAVHEMTFSGVTERDGKLYGRFYTVRALILDKVTGKLTELVNDDPGARCVLMRENLGEVYVRGLEDAEETLMYDFMLQDGDVFHTGDGDLTVVEMPVTEKDFYPDSMMSHNDTLKTYSFEGMTDRIGVTEYTGLWGNNAGTIVNPMFAGGQFGGVEWPWVPAPDCTLAAQWEMQRAMDEFIRVDIYSNPEALEKVDALGIYSGTDMTVSETDAPRWYTLQGLPVAEPQPGQLLIRIAGDRAEKVMY